jgi:group I intron endonuclease
MEAIPDRTSAVYQIVNRVNGKRYIGSSVDLRSRWDAHRYGLIGGYHENKHLQNAWNKYGGDQFEFKVIYYCLENETIENEQLFIDKLSPEYNIANNVALPMLGRHHTEESKRKMSEAQKGNVGVWHGKNLSEEHKHKISEALKGKNNPRYGEHLSEEHRQKLSEAKMGQYPSQETRRKLSKANKGKNNPNYGKRHTNEAKRKMSENHPDNSGKNNYRWINFTAVEMNEMRELRNSGCTYRAIGKRFGVSADTIASRLRND